MLVKQLYIVSHWVPRGGGLGLCAVCPSIRVGPHHDNSYNNRLTDGCTNLGIWIHVGMIKCHIPKSCLALTSDLLQKKRVPAIFPILQHVVLTSDCALTLPTLAAAYRPGFANSVDPDEPAHTSRLLRICTICKYSSIFKKAKSPTV